ncbi:DinB family protein [Nocardia stercoris]|uniref:DinB family protein n=1 Tax=Nocardia stercoris TaxID=2483361 RepID=A0A3M2KWS7_9NOCA|nr:DinB family protein [Nocardia stercoris]RMI29484.1 DinB family protein [Nocardia stercoris]
MAGPARITDGPERALVENMLDRNRAALIETAKGLSENESRRQLVVSATTPIGLVKHAAVAERFWFQRFLSGLSESECDGSASPGTESFAVADDETLESVIAEFERACARSREIAAGMELDDTKPNSRGEAVSLRWVYLHMIEELARHAGHGDILREQIVAERTR